MVSVSPCCRTPTRMYSPPCQSRAKPKARLTTGLFVCAQTPTAPPPRARPAPEHPHYSGRRVGGRIGGQPGTQRLQSTRKINGYYFYYPGQTTDPGCSHLGQRPIYTLWAYFCQHHKAAALARLLGVERYPVDRRGGSRRHGTLTATANLPAAAAADTRLDWRGAAYTTPRNSINGRSMSGLNS